MKQIHLTRAVSLLLTALLLSSAGCLHLEQVTDPVKPETTEAPGQDPATETDPPEAGPQPASPATDPEAEPFLPDKDVLSEALALALTGWGTDYLNDPNGLWSVIGYYAALSARLEAPDAVPWISDSACETLCTVLQSVLRSGEDPLPRPDWLGKEGAAAETRDGADGWRFDDYARMLDETLGVWRALDLTVESGTRIVTVEDHLDDGVRSCLLYAAFENPPDADENDPEPLVYLVLTDFITPEGLPVTDPADNPDGYPGGLNDDGRGEDENDDLVSLLTRENLAEANGVEKLLFTYGGFHITETAAMDGADDLISDSWYLVDDPGILSVTEGHALNADMALYTYTNYSFWDGENILYASVGGEGVSASFFVGEDTPAGIYPGNDQFFYEFYDAPAEILESDAETVTFRTAPEILDGRTLVYTVLRDSLAVLSFERHDADGTLTYSRTAEYGRDKVDDFMAPFRRDVSNQRIIRIRGTLYSRDADPVEFDYFLHVPKEWRLTVVGPGELFLYANENFTNSVDNPIEPGEEDLTLWASNAAG